MERTDRTAHAARTIGPPAFTAIIHLPPAATDAAANRPMMRRATIPDACEPVKRSGAGAGVLLFPILLCLLSAQGVCATGPGGVDKEYEERVQEARKYDPMWCRQEDRDREKAVELYRAALSLRTDDPRNIEVEYRIAELYAYYSDPTTREKVMPEKAAAVFEHIVNTYSRNQLRWVESNIGLACCCAMLGNPSAALEYYRRVLEVDPDAIEIPLGRESEAPEEAARWAKKRVEEVRLMTVDTIAYVSRRVSPGEEVRQMAHIAEHYKGMDVGEKAAAVLAADMGSSGKKLAEGGLDAFAEAPLRGDEPPQVKDNSTSAAGGPGRPGDARVPAVPSTDAGGGSRLRILRVCLLAGVVLGFGLVIVMIWRATRRAGRAR